MSTKDALKQCEEALRPVLGRGIGFSPGPETDATDFLLKGNGQTTAVDSRGDEWPALRLLDDSEGASFWVTVRIRFEWSRTERHLRDAGAYFFRGTATTSSKAPLFRAEWHQWPGSSDKAAQPHWHVYPDAAADKSPANADIKAALLAPEDVRSGVQAIGHGIVVPDSHGLVNSFKMSHFHFAMCGPWVWGADRPNVLQNPLSVASVATWLSRCLEYTRAQLDWIANRSAR